MTKHILITALTAILLTIVAIPAAELTAQCSGTEYGSPIYGQPVYQGPHYQPLQYQPTVRIVPSVPYRSNSTAVAVPANVTEAMRQAKNKTDVARAFFRTAQYGDAQRHLDSVVKLVPNDTNAYQFRALTLFAQGNYSEAAADAYDSLGMGNTWTVEVLDSIYPVADRYHHQLAKLKQQTESNPSMSTHFLLAYHYLMLNDLGNGKVELEKVLKLQPGEPLTTQLLAAVSAKINPATSPATLAGKDRE